MTPQQIDAMKLALEALEVDAYVYNGEKSWKAITALKEVLAEHAMRETQRLGQEIEPDDIASILACRDMLDAQPVPPRAWVGLTDEQAPMVYEAVWSGGPTNKDYEDAMRLKRLNQLATSPQRKPLTEEDCRTGFREQDAKWTFRNMTAWQVWRTACEWNEAAHDTKENT